VTNISNFPLSNTHTERRGKTKQNKKREKREKNVGKKNTLNNMKFTQITMQNYSTSLTG
jgi:hypothetical protein